MSQGTLRLDVESTLIRGADGADCLLARRLGRVVIGNQPPAPLLLYPHPGKARVTGNSFTFILANHCREAGLHSRVSIDAHLNFIGGDRLKFQTARREI